MITVEINKYKKGWKDENKLKKWKGNIKKEKNKLIIIIIIINILKSEK